MLKKSLIAALALSVGIAFSPLSTVGATTLFGPGTKVQAEQPVELARKKKKAKKAKKAKSKAGRCGTNMYWSKKAKKCLDARAKR